MNFALLRSAARAWNIQPSYVNTQGQVVWAKAEVLCELLAGLSQRSVKTDSDLESLIAAKENERWSMGLAPAHVAWGGSLPPLRIRIAGASARPQKISATLSCEDGQSLNLPLELSFSRPLAKGILIELNCLGPLPLGYHQLRIQIDGREFSSFIISAPEAITAAQGRSWGGFIPLYALRTARDWGCGSLADLTQAMRFTGDYGAKWVSTLPILAGKFESPDCDPSPYCALSRLFWNEIYLDVEGLIAKYNHQRSRELLADPEVQRQIASLRERTHVDYYSVYQLKKKFLRPLAEDFFASGEEQSAAYRAFQAENPEIDKYAAFRSPERAEQRLHKFSQFEMSQSLAALKEKSPVGLYLDFPVGVNDSGFDFKEFRGIFFAEVTVGAPPEPVFAKGQEWGFPSFHPVHHRASNYLYFRKILRHHLRYAKMLRIDHVMGLYRVFCVPKGRPPSDGVYLRFPPEELFAIAVLETQRAGADLIGENLGTVPAGVESVMAARNIKGMWVWQMASADDVEACDRKVPENALACVNTHDMPMLRAFESGEDLTRVASLGILDAGLAKGFAASRRVELQRWHARFGKPELGEKFYQWLTQIRAKYLVLTIEDLWGEAEPQNIPGTYREYPNWRRRFSRPLESWPNEKLLTAAIRAAKENRGV